MPAIDREIPQNLKPYDAHGLVLDLLVNGQAMGDCPFCHGTNKFGVSVETGQWRCLACNEGSNLGTKEFRGGNIYTFMRILWDRSVEETSDHDCADLAKERKLSDLETIRAWGVCRSIITGEWLVPGYSADGKLNQLYRYTEVYEDGRWVHRLRATTGVGHQLHGVNLLDPDKEEVWVCEGPWDGMILWETLRTAKAGESGDLILTGREENSLLANINVLAVPGAGVFSDSWHSLFSGKAVRLLYDNDHPRINRRTGQKMPPAGWVGMKRVAKILSELKEPPTSISYLHWAGEQDRDHNPELPDGLDVRDVLTATDGENGDGRAAPSRRGRLSELPKLYGRMRPAPDSWLGSHTGDAGGGKKEMLPEPCSSFQELMEAWQDSSFEMTDEMRYGLVTMLAVAASTMVPGDQLWVRVMSPASSGKTTLCEALGVSKKYVFSISNFTGIHSGFKSDSDGKEDNSLVAQIDRKTVVIKEGDPLLKNMNKDQIMADLRDLYDGVCRVFYRNQLFRKYEGLRVTVIICGTTAMKVLDASDLGERFLDIILMDEINEKHEKTAVMSVLERTDRCMSMETNGKVASQYDPKIAHAMQVTGGYLQYLRENAASLMQNLTSRATLEEIMDLGIFVAFSRARPSRKQDEMVERELGTRVAAQLLRMARLTAVVLNKPQIDGDVMKVVRQVAMDTARGHSLNIIRTLFRAGPRGLQTTGVCSAIVMTEDRALSLLRFLRKIKVVSVRTDGVGMGTRHYWYLKQRVRDLYSKVMAERADES